MIQLYISGISILLLTLLVTKVQSLLILFLLYSLQILLEIPSNASLLKLFKSEIRKNPFSKSVNFIISNLNGISPDFSKDSYEGCNLHFGVRELAMTAIGNGIMLHGGLRAFVSTFFVFSDYVKPMARLSSIMGVPLTFVLTHDSIGVGEDGPTHEPIEQLAMFRAMPNFTIYRPCDYKETAAAWQYAIQSEKTPTALVLSRQNLPDNADKILCYN